MATNQPITTLEKIEVATDLINFIKIKDQDVQQEIYVAALEYETNSTLRPEIQKADLTEHLLEIVGKSLSERKFRSKREISSGDIYTCLAVFSGTDGENNRERDVRDEMLSYIDDRLNGRLRGHMSDDDVDPDELLTYRGMMKLISSIPEFDQEMLEVLFLEEKQR